MSNERKTDYEKNEDKYFRLLYPSINTLLEKFGFEHKIIKHCPRDFVSYEGKLKRCDFVGFLDNGDILNVEAQSTPITLKDKKKFFDYATYYSIKNQGKNRKVHTLVLSSYYEENDSVDYEWHGSSPFTIPYKSFNSFNAEKTINKISLKNKNKEELDKCEIDDLRILTFMESERSHKELLIESVKLTNETVMNQNERVYTKTLQSFLARKFIQDDKEYRDVMKMIRINSGELGGVFDRIEKIGIEKGRRMEKKEEKEKYDKKIELMENEMKRKGINLKDIQEIIEIGKKK